MIVKDQTILIWILVHNSIWQKKNIARAEFLLKKPETETNVQTIFLTNTKSCQIVPV